MYNILHRINVWMDEWMYRWMYDVNIDEQHIVYSPCITTIDGSKSCIVKIPKKKKKKQLVGVTNQGGLLVYDTLVSNK